MIEISYNCAKLEALGEKGYNRKTFHGLPSRDHAHMERRNYDPEYFAYYKSHTASNSAISEASAKGTKAVLNPYKKLTTIMLVLGAVLTVYTMKNMIFTDEPEPAVEVPTKEVLNDTNKVQVIDNKELSLPVPTPEKTVIPEYSQTQKEQIKRIKESKKYHPFHNVSLHIAGTYKDNVLGDNMIFFSASYNGQKMFNISLKEIILAGYTLKVLGDCVVELKYLDYSEFVLCDVPRVETGVQEIASN